jgi:hypothetical protein
LFFGMGVIVALLIEYGANRKWMELPAPLVFIFCGLFYAWHLHGKPIPVDHYYDHTDVFPLKIRQSTEAAANHAVIDQLRTTQASFSLVGDAVGYTSLALRRAPTNLPVLFTHFSVPGDPTLRLQWEHEFLESFEQTHPQYIFMGLFSKQMRTLPKLNAYLGAHYTQCDQKADFCFASEASR